MNTETAQPWRLVGGRWLLLAVGALGISCITTQLVLLREMLCVFAGNELVLGIVLGNWLLLMGVGAWLGRWNGHLEDPAGTFLSLQLLIAFLPIAEVLATRYLCIEVFLPGTTISIPATIISSFFVLLPFCLAAGFLLTLSCTILTVREEGRSAAGWVYVADSGGSIFGGAIVSLCLLKILNSFALLAIVGFLNLLAMVWLSCLWRRRWILASVIIAAACLGWVYARSDELNSRQLEYASATLLFQGNSPYGELVVTRENGQTNFIQNGLPVLSTHNTEQVEEAVHYAMAQRPDAQRVLLIGGGVAGTAKELLKYRAQVTCVELDPLFLELGRRFLPKNLSDPRIHVVNTDGRRFVQTANERFDVMILDLPDPSTAQLNRFHTAEFLAEAKRALATNGVLALAVGRYENYVSQELSRLLASAHRTLGGVFTNVVMLPGGRVFFLASDGALGTDIAGRLERAGIATQYVNRHYLDGMLTPDRLAALDRAVTVYAPMNRDFNPVLYFRHLRHWASQFDRRAGFVEVALGLVLLAYVVRLRGAAAAVFAGGFAASSLEVVLLLGLQALCGSLYYQLAVIVTVFMAGLAVGAAWANRLMAFGLRRQNDSGDGALAGGSESGVSSQPSMPASQSGVALRLPPQFTSKGRLVALALAVAALAALLPLALWLLSKAPSPAGSNLGVQVAINLLTFFLAALVGAQFPVANRMDGSSTGLAASRVYTADFLGASVGALLASALLIPMLGVTIMCWLAAGLNLLGAAAVVLARPKPG